MPSLYELDGDPETDILLGEDGASNSAGSYLKDSTSFLRPHNRPKRRTVVSRAAGAAILLMMLVVLTVTIATSIRKHHGKLLSEAQDFSLHPKDTQTLRRQVFTNPNVECLEPEYFHEHDSERVRIKYGPYTVPPSQIPMQTFPEPKATMPCHNCLITWFQADLIYDNGTVANADTGMWLHHTVLTNLARKDAQGCTSWRGERFFASGNERTLVDLSLNGTENNGYYLAESDPVYIFTELMNEHSTPVNATLAITYEYIPYKPDDFEVVTTVWFDVTGCGESDVPVPQNETSFHYSSPTWTSTIDGRLVVVFGHLHEGGTHLEVKKNHKTVCTSIPTYSAEGMELGDQMQNDDVLRRQGDDMGMIHNTKMSGCDNLGKIEAGEKWKIRADYNIAAHPPMLNDGTGAPEPVMGIAPMYLVEG